jgi:phage-related minor tail protein
MADDNKLQFVLSMKDEATQALKNVQGSLDGVAKSTEHATEKVKAHASAMDEVLEAFRKEGPSAATSIFALKGLEKAHESLLERAGELSRELGALGRVLGGLGPAGVLAGGAIASMVEAGKSFSELQTLGVRLDATLASIGQQGKISFDELKEQADKLSFSTLFKPDDIIKAGTALAQNGALSGDKIKELLPTVLNFASEFNQSLEESSDQISRILQNPIMGLQLLARYTRDVTEADRQRVKEAVDAGNYDEARAVIIDKLNARTKDFAQNMTQGLAGSYELVKNQAELYFEEGARHWGEEITNALHLEDAWKRIGVAIADARKVHNEAYDLEAAANKPGASTGAKIGWLQYQQEHSSGSVMGSEFGGLSPDQNDALLQQQIVQQQRIAASRYFPGENSMGDAGGGAGGFGPGQSTDVQKVIGDALAFGEKLDENSKKLQEAQGHMEQNNKAIDSATQMYGADSSQVRELTHDHEILAATIRDLAIPSMEQFARASQQAAQLAAMTKGDQEQYNERLKAATSYVKDHPEAGKAEDNVYNPVVMQSADTALALKSVAEAARKHADALADYSLELKAKGKGPDADRAKAQLARNLAMRGIPSNMAGTAAGDLIGNEAYQDALMQAKIGRAGKDTKQTPVGEFDQRTQQAQFESGLLSQVLGGSMSLGRVKVNVEAYGDAVKEAQQHTSSFQAAMAKLQPLIEARIQAENQTFVLQTKVNAQMQDEVSKAKFQGVLPGLKAQFQMQGQQKGLTPGTQAMTDYQSAALNEQQSKVRDQWATQSNSNQDDLDKLTQEKNLVFDTSLERQQILATLQLENQAKESGIPLDDQMLQTAKDQVTNYLQQKQALDDIANGPFAQFMSQQKDAFVTLQEVGVSAVNDIGSAFTSVITGATSFKSAVDKLITSLASMAASAAFKSLSGSAMSALGGLFSSAASPATALASGIAPLAMGGIMGPGGLTSLRRYASGGVATSPQIALFGEGAHNEAYVPLPDGRSIPVSMNGGGGHQFNNHFNVTVNNSGSGGGGGAGNPQDVGNSVAAGLRNMVTSVIADQLRTGGSLNPAMGA